MTGPVDDDNEPASNDLMSESVENVRNAGKKIYNVENVGFVPSEPVLQMFKMMLVLRLVLKDHVRYQTIVLILILKMILFLIRRKIL